MGILGACGPSVGATPDAGITVTDAPLFDARPACDLHCSSDLHSVLDCNNNVVIMCPIDQGCGGSGCVPACEAAAANQSAIGCDFFSVAPDIVDFGRGACFAAFIANTWSAPITLGVTRNGVSYDLSGFARIPSGTGMGLTYNLLPGGQLPAGEVAILFLARTGSILNDCPAGVTPALTLEHAAIAGTGLGLGFNITASAPVAAYDIYPYGGGASAATSATLLLPTSVWGTNYVAVNAYAKSVLIGAGVPSMDIVASEDNTTVTINPVTAIVGGAGVASTPAGVPKSYTLQRGEVLQFSQVAELTGSAIEADKPIGVWGGASCLSVPVTQFACDSAHQQIPPIKALGSEYVAVRYRNRFDGAEEWPPWRLLGVADGTTLTYLPAAPAGAPALLQAGQVVEFRAAGPFVVTSQDAEHPFYVAGYMTGCFEVSPSNDCRGDPEFVNVVPAAQYLDQYTFFTDPTYSETNLVLTRRRTENGFFDVDLDCAGVLTGWQPIDAQGDFEYTRIDLVRGDFMGQGNCDNGRHVITSGAPFGLTVWGWGSSLTSGFSTTAVSYAYPAGASIGPINSVELPIPQ